MSQHKFILILSRSWFFYLLFHQRYRQLHPLEYSLCAVNALISFFLLLSLVLLSCVLSSVPPHYWSSVYSWFVLFFYLSRFRRLRWASEWLLRHYHSLRYLVFTFISSFILQGDSKSVYRIQTDHKWQVCNDRIIRYFDTKWGRKQDKVMKPHVNKSLLICCIMSGLLVCLLHKDNLPSPHGPLVTIADFRWLRLAWVQIPLTPAILTEGFKVFRNATRQVQACYLEQWFSIPVLRQLIYSII